MSEEQQKLTIVTKRKNEAFSTLSTEDMSIKYNGKEMLDIRSLRIEMSLEEATWATVEILDCDLDLEDIPFTVEVDELEARKLLKRILQDSGTTLSIPLLNECLEMTNGMPDVVDVTTRDNDGFRKREKTD